MFLRNNRSGAERDAALDRIAALEADQALHLALLQVCPPE